MQSPPATTTRRRRTRLDYICVMVELKKQGMGIQQIADKYGITPGSASQAMLKYQKRNQCHENTPPQK